MGNVHLRRYLGSEGYQGTSNELPATCFASIAALFVMLSCDIDSVADAA